MKEKIKILVTDDHPVIRRGLVMEINSAPDLEVVGEAENGQVALQKVSQLMPQIIVLDIDMPILDGIETAKILNDKFPEVKVVFLSMHKEKEIIQSISKLKMMGYVLKDSAVLEIVDCLKQVANGEKFISQPIKELLQDVKETVPKENVLNSPVSLLSSAELEILEQISQLKTNRDIAESLFISIRTVENHRYKICRKLELQGNHSLLKFALDNKTLILDSIKDK